VITLSSKISAVLNSIKQRIVKVNGQGPYDPRTAYDVAPFGIDGVPPANWRAVDSKTAVAGSEVLVGYINQNATSVEGELKLYSMDGISDSITLILRTDGTMEIGGSTKHMVRYEELETGFNSLKQSVTDLTTAFNSHVHATVASLGTPTPPTAVPTVIPVIPPTATITGAKINEIKTL